MLLADIGEDRVLDLQEADEQVLQTLSPKLTWRVEVRKNYCHIYVHLRSTLTDASSEATGPDPFH